LRRDLLTEPAPIVSSAIDLHIARLDRALTEVEAARALLARDELERADRFRFPADRRRFTLARAGLRRLVGTVLSVPPESLVFEPGAHGKPALGGPWRGQLEINVAHSHEIALYAVCLDGPVGVDVEWLRNVPDQQTIARSHFAASERATLDALPLEDRTLAFFRCWTRKEAFVKALGEGLSHPLDRFEVTLAPDVPARLVAIDGDAAAAAAWSLFSLDPEPGYVAAVAAPRAPLELRYRRGAA